MVLPHIRLWVGDDGRVRLEVEDDELFDFIDDFLCEQGDLEFEWVEVTERPGLNVHTMVFPTGLPEAVLQTLLDRLSPEEIESIFKLNNGA